MFFETGALFGQFFALSFQVLPLSLQPPSILLVLGAIDFELLQFFLEGCVVLFQHLAFGMDLAAFFGQFAQIGVIAPVAPTPGVFFNRDSNDSRSICS